MSTVMTDTCDSCGAAASYRGDGTNGVQRRDVYCEPCAIRYGYERRGEAYVAMKTLGFAISLLRTGGLDDSAISAMVHEILSEPHSTGEYDIGGDGFLPGPDRVAERPWMVGFVPLTGD